VTAWFGRTWHAPINDGPWVATPVGELCLYCEQPIEEDDSGVLMGVVVSALVNLDPPADPSARESSYTMRPEHRKCFLTQVLGT
jgi:hypothetical protein